MWRRAHDGVDAITIGRATDRYAISGLAEMTTPLAQIVRLHKAIGHPVRLRLLSMLRSGPLCVCQMTAVVGLAASTISEHLSELRGAGLVAEKKEGRWVEYRLSENATARAVLDAVWIDVDSDPTTRADALLIRELRRVPLDELCGAGLDLTRLDRPRLQDAASRASRMRGRS